MKSKLLLIAIFILNIAWTQNLVISEIMVNPPDTDIPYEYIELRGDPEATIADGTYLIQVEGDGNDPGDIESNEDASNGCTINNDGVTPCPEGGIINLSGVTIGSNGYVVLLNNNHNYTVNPNATILLDLTDGDLEGPSHTFFLINTNGNDAPSSDDDIDVDNDGEIDDSYANIWTFLDGVSFADDDGTIEYAYANVIFADDTALPILQYPDSATVILTSTPYDYAARIGNSTGDFVDNNASNDNVDWVGGDVLSSSSSPRLWILASNTNSVRTHPESWEGSQLNHVGGPNPTQNTLLSVENFEETNFKIYPIPTNTILNIEANTNDLDLSVQLYNLLGSKIFEDKITNSKIDVSGLNKGLYMLKIISDNQVIDMKKIIVE